MAAFSPTPERRQVVIVGAGITGVSLALMLQRLGVDYVLLEAYDRVASQAGAGVGLYANGLRVLDQLGVLDDVVAASQLTNVQIYRDGETGRRIMDRVAKPLLEARHGYANRFLARYDLMRVLLGHVEDADSRIRVNQRVARIEDDPVSGAARVYTEAGAVFEAQVVVGADGARSAVRAEMWRNADAAAATSTSTSSSGSGSIPASDRGPVPCEHSCLWAVAPQPPTGIVPGDVIGVAGPHTTAGLMCGADGRVFTFWFWTTPPGKRSVPIEAIPRPAPEEIERELARAADTIVADTGLRLGDLVGPSSASGAEVVAATTLPHYVLKRWHHGRIVLVGDSAHLFNPLVGQGANCCLESAAALVNALQQHQKDLSSPFWSRQTLGSAFVALEDTRVARLQTMVATCQDAMRSMAWESWFSKLKLKYLAPLVSLSTFADVYTRLMIGGVSLQGNGFPRPKAPHQMPYTDEIDEASKVLAKGGASSAMSIAGAVGAALAAGVVAVFYLRPGSLGRG